jgi:integrase
MALTNRNVVFAKPGRHHAGVQGLYLYVTPDQQVRRWIYRYTSPVTRRVTEAGLGLIQVLPLAEARAKALDLQKQIASGICPIAARRAQRVVPLAQTFGECAEAWIKTHEPSWRSISQLHNVKTLLFGHGKPLLAVPVSAVTPNMVQSALSELWTQHPNQARRALAAFARVLDLAKARGAREGDNPAAWRANMEYQFPKMCPTRGAHYSAMNYTELPEFLRRLRVRQSRSVGARALEFLILTCARTGEVLNITWDEIDLEAKVWTLAAMRTKQGRAHRVPLSTKALKLLEQQQSCNKFVFSEYNRRQLSDKSMLHVLKAMGVNVTVHGFRSTFRNWAGDETNFQREHIEECLGHQVGNAVERAYRRSDALEKRRTIMQAWCEYCHDDR